MVVISVKAIYPSLGQWRKRVVTETDYDFEKYSLSRIIELNILKISFKVISYTIQAIQNILDFIFCIFDFWFMTRFRSWNYFLAHERDPLVDVPDRLHHRSMNVPRGYLNVQSPFSTFSTVCDLFKARKAQKLSWNVQEWSETGMVRLDA